MAVPFNIIVAVDAEFGIGKEGRIPWHISADLKRFKDITTRTSGEDKKNLVVMGRKTWGSLPPRFRPLPGRINLVLTRNEKAAFPQGVLKAGSLTEALDFPGKSLGSLVDQVFVIGGAQIFQEALAHPLCQRLYMTRVMRNFGCDVFFPREFASFRQVSRGPLGQEDGIEYYFEEYQRLQNLT